MEILFNDVIQLSDAPKQLKSPALSEVFKINEQPINIKLDKERIINCIGIGNTDGNWFMINGHNVDFNGNGLYLIPRTATDSLIITTNATYIGRIAAGISCHIPTSITKEPAFCSTSEPRVTLSGQIISGVGGYNYKAVSLDSRYKINEFILSEIKEGYKYIGMGYPFFIDLTEESYKLPFNKLYATERNQRQMGFESGVKRYLYSRRFEFEERF